MSTMSYVDLAPLALHRRHEMEARINVLATKCDQAITNISKLKLHANNFVHQLDCEPSELKERFLNSMKKLDEYIYLITDFTLSIENLGTDNMKYTPVHDTRRPPLQPLQPLPAFNFNIMDVLSELAPTASTACPNLCPVEKLHRKVPKEEQSLIVFSSASCSSESVPARAETHVQCAMSPEPVVTAVGKMTITGPTSSNGSTLASNGSTSVSKGPTSTSNDPNSTSNGPTSADVADCDINLPAQTVLQTDQVYQAFIIHVDGASIWIITADPGEVYNLNEALTSYCKENRVTMAPEDIQPLSFYAFYDNDGYYYRGLFLGLVEDQIGVAMVFLMDTGEVRYGSVACLQPLPEAFSTQPRYARWAHLAGVELEETEEAMKKYEEFLDHYVGEPCSVKVDDNTSESLGVYIRVGSEWLHEAAAARGLARIVDNPSTASSIRDVDPKRALISAPTESVDSDELDITNCPEYEDPVEAVTGHRYRDEADICKHYKGGPERTCFKGERCTKRHVLMHPGGWPVEQVLVPGKVPAALLPAPGTRRRVTVTCVAKFNQMYAQFEPEETPTELPSFGVMMPPATLDALIQDMNSPASRIAYKPFKLRPGKGELVAAKYPTDEQWYRARALDLSEVDKKVQVMFIDYGNEEWVEEDAISSLEPRYCVLPAQATTCVLAGAAPKGYDSTVWAKAKQALTDAVQDRTLRVHIIARDYDEVTVEIFDEHGYSIAEQLAAKDLITLTEYQVIDDTNVTQKVTVP